MNFFCKLLYNINSASVFAIWFRCTFKSENKSLYSCHILVYMPHKCVYIVCLFSCIEHKFKFQLIFSRDQAQAKEGEKDEGEDPRKLRGILFRISSDIFCGGGPAGNTLIRSSRFRSGGEHFDPELAVKARRGS